MKILPPPYNIQIKDTWVPLKDARGPRLDLTPKEKETIANLLRELEGYREEVERIRSRIENMQICSRRDYWATIIVNLEKSIEFREKKIKAIKMARIAEQRAQAAKELDTIA